MLGNEREGNVYKKIEMPTIPLPLLANVYKEVATCRVVEFLQVTDGNGFSPHVTNGIEHLPILSKKHSHSNLSI